MTAKDVSQPRRHASRARSCSPSCSARCRRPIAKFVRTLNEVPTKFVRGLAAVRDQKEQAAA